METIDDVLAEVDEAFRFEADRSYQDRAHGYIDRRDITRSARDTAVQCTVRDLVERAYECGMADGKVGGLSSADEARLQGGDGSVTGALSANPGMKQTTYVVRGGAVRRLTPRECERLQGFPDDWTKVPYKGKPEDECPDTPRYKAIGNSMAVPVMRWIGERMQKAEEACQST